MKILTIIGARPQIIKAAAISRAIEKKYKKKIKEVIVHTGQHYDNNMSEIFFQELGIPFPEYNLLAGSAAHGKQTAKMLEGIEEIIFDEKPDAVLVYGDTNSTVAGGLAASKLHIPLIHIEAGLRSFNKRMPEEINRILCDHMSTQLFTPTKKGVENLRNEGFSIDDEKQKIDQDNPQVYHCGDIMYDNSLYFSEVSDKKSDILKKLEINPHTYIFSTIHRDSNTDDPEKLQEIFEALLQIAEQTNIILPLHPRTRKRLNELPDDFKQKIYHHEHLNLIHPVSFLNVIALEKNANMVITDSGGVQKEAFFFEKPCLILREQTEWEEIVSNGNALITDSKKDKIISGYEELSVRDDFTYPNYFGDGAAAEFVCQRILEDLKI